jgi:hypothetical protein
MEGIVTMEDIIETSSDLKLLTRRILLQTCSNTQGKGGKRQVNIN